MNLGQFVLSCRGSFDNIIIDLTSEMCCTVDTEANKK